LRLSFESRRDTAMPKNKRSDAEKTRRKAIARWENEGGADPCGPQVPGVAKDCGEEEQEEARRS
jgi:hypothetical protein